MVCFYLLTLVIVFALNILKIALGNRNAVGGGWGGKISHIHMRVIHMQNGILQKEII